MSATRLASRPTPLPRAEKAKRVSKTVLAVVVSYNPQLKALRRTLDALIEQACDVIVVDNGSSNTSALASLCDEYPQVVFAPQTSNLGLGAAHNIGISHARKLSYPYLLLMDQDSVPMQGMVAALRLAHAKQSESSLVSAVGVSYLNADTGVESFFIKFGRLKFSRRYCGERDEFGCLEADFLISSGSLISINTLNEVGDMDESLFIDHVDTEWFLRCKNLGYKAYGVCDAIMQHGLGEQTHRLSLGGRTRNVPQHKPFRYYYIMRNSVLLYRRGYCSGWWKWNDIQRLSLIFLVFGFIKSPRLDNLRMMVRGLVHGVRGVSGPMRDA